MIFVLFLFSISLINFSSCKKVETIRIYTTNGLVEGYINDTFERPVKIFKGIPFAEPPVSNLRYALPKPKNSWKSTWNATYYRHACMTNSSLAHKNVTDIGEDCLYLNIWADKRCTKAKPCPIIVLIHGGSFIYGSATQQHEDFIIPRYACDRIMFIAPAYRLGPFGFLDLGSDELVPRNLGLHDQILALKWAQKEARSFGGDPKKVTLFGYSSGAVAIQFHLVSPAVPRNLFSGALISSGVPEQLIGIETNASEALLESSGCKNHSNLLDCLQKIDAKILLQLSRDIEDTQKAFFNGIAVDTKLFRNKTYIELLNKTKAMPLMLGGARDEADYDVHNLTYICEKYIVMFGYSGQEVVKACVKKYDVFEGIDKYTFPLADGMKAMTYLQAITNSNKGYPTYVFDFQLVNHSQHAGDISFMIGSYRNEILTPEEKLVDEFYAKAVKNYVRTGNPGYGWLPFNNDTNWLIFDAASKNNITFGPYLSKEPYYPEDVKFWLNDLRKIDEKHRKVGEAKVKDAILMPDQSLADKTSSNTLFLAIVFLLLILVILLVVYWDLIKARCRKEVEMEDVEKVGIVKSFGLRYS